MLNAIQSSSTRSIRCRTARATSVAVRADSKPRIGGLECNQKVGERKEVASSGKMFKVRFLAAGGDSREIECPDNVYILDEAEKKGIDLPATCRGGICGACVARVVKGSVDQSDIPDLEFTVSEQEQKDGMALLCMARATSDIDLEIQSDWGYSLGVSEWKGATGAFSATPIPLMEKKK